MRVGAWSLDWSQSMKHRQRLRDGTPIVPFSDEAKQMFKQLRLSEAELNAIVRSAQAEVLPRFTDAQGRISVQGVRRDIEALYERDMEWEIMHRLRALKQERQ